MFNDIQETITSRLAGLAPQIQDRLVEAVVESTLTKVSDLTLRGYRELEKLQADFTKLKPDQISYDDDGNVVASSWSKGKLDARNAAQKKIERLTNALNKILTTGDAAELNKVLGGDKGDKSESDA